MFDQKRATTQGVTSDIPSRRTRSGVADDEALLGVAEAYFRRLVLEPRAARGIAAAIYATAHAGEPRAIGPIGVHGRSYHVERRHGDLSIRSNNGEMRLPLRVARRLATWLDNASRRQPGDVAA